jgi:hypothetical protein
VVERILRFAQDDIEGRGIRLCLSGKQTFKAGMPIAPGIGNPRRLTTMNSR